jgi:L,D-transpeptidase YbiS
MILYLEIGAMLYINIKNQSLSYFKDGTQFRTFPISSALAGLGEVVGSGKTPRGRHIIRAKIGADAPVGSVFVGRRATGEIHTDELSHLHPYRDWILSRILWLSGVQPGFNRGGRVDTMRRFIYIHGCPDSSDFSAPSSHGCIRMRNHDIITLFNLVCVQELVFIDPGFPSHT